VTATKSTSVSRLKPGTTTIATTRPKARRPLPATPNAWILRRSVLTLPEATILAALNARAADRISTSLSTPRVGLARAMMAMATVSRPRTTSETRSQ